LQLHDQQLQLVPDIISDVSSHGASICFAKENVPNLAAGDEVTVRILSPQLHGQISLAARISFTDDNSRGRLVGLRFIANKELMQQCNQDLFQLFVRHEALVT